jgi:YHS domain-containing protein
LALEGYDAVALVQKSEFVRGEPSRQRLFDSQIYRFASDANAALFDQDPIKYVPVLGGLSVVAWNDQHKAAPGTVQYHVSADGRLHLLVNEAETSQLRADPARYRDADVVLGGVSPVSLVDKVQQRPGSAAFAVIYEGHRVLLADGYEKKTFLANPGKYFPTLCGLDPVTVVDGQPQLGSPRFAITYKNRLYVFLSAESRARFVENLAAYSDIDVSHSGLCAVTLVDHQEQVEGHYGTSVICLGRRYLFRTDAERERFAADPTKYLSALLARPDEPPGS